MLTKWVQFVQVKRMVDDLKPRVKYLEKQNKEVHSENQALRRKMNDLLKEHKKLLDAFYNDT